MECRKRGPQPNVVGRSVRRAMARGRRRERRRRPAGRGRPSPRRSRWLGSSWANSASSGAGDGRGVAEPVAVAAQRADLDGPSVAAGAAAAPRPVSSSSRAAALALSTSGWSNGLMPSSRPATAVATSHSSIWAPSEPLTATSERVGSTATTSVSSEIGSSSASTLTSRTTVTSSAGHVTSGSSSSADDREHAGAVLAGRLGDELLGPVGEADDAGAVVDEARACRAAGSVPADGRAEPQRRVGVVVGGEQVGDRLGVVEQRLDVHAGQAARARARTRSARSSDRPRRGRR